MNATIITSIATLVAVIVTHLLNQRAGEKRASQVREELINRIEALDRRVTESRDDLRERISDVKHDLKEFISSEIGHVKADIHAMKAEIIAALPPRARGASGEYHR